MNHDLAITCTVSGAAPIPGCRIVGLVAADTVALTPATAIGVTLRSSSPIAVGSTTSVAIYGIQKIEANAAIPVGSKVGRNIADGRAVVWASGQCIGTAVTAAATAGDIVEVALGIGA
jgi:hypothetical protein